MNAYVEKLGSFIEEGSQKSENKFNPLVFALDELTDELKSGESFAEDAEKLYGLFASILKYPNWGLRQTVAYALGYLAPFTSGDLVQALIAQTFALQHDDKREVRDAAAESLGMIIAACPGELDAIKSRVISHLNDDESWEHLEGALMAAGRFMARRPDAAAGVLDKVFALATLTEKFGFYAEYVRYQSLRALDRYARAASADLGSVREVVTARMVDPSLNVRRAAAEVWATALGDDKFTRDGLKISVESLASDEWRLRQAHAIALEAFAAKVPTDLAATIIDALIAISAQDLDDNEACQAAAAAVKAAAVVIVATRASTDALGPLAMETLRGSLPWLIDAGCQAVLAACKSGLTIDSEELLDLQCLVHRARFHPSLPIRIGAATTFRHIHRLRTGDMLTAAEVDGKIWDAAMFSRYHGLAKDLVESGTNDALETTFNAYTVAIATLPAAPEEAADVCDLLFESFVAGEGEGTASIQRAAALRTLAALSDAFWANHAADIDTIAQAAQDFEDDAVCPAAITLLSTIDYEDVAKVLYPLTFAPTDAVRTSASIALARTVGEAQSYWARGNDVAEQVTKLVEIIGEETDLDVDPVSLRTMRVHGLVRFINQLFPCREPFATDVPQEDYDVEEFELDEETVLAADSLIDRVLCSQEDEEAHAAAVAAAILLHERCPPFAKAAKNKAASKWAESVLAGAEWEVDVDFDEDDAEAISEAIEAVEIDEEGEPDEESAAYRLAAAFRASHARTKDTLASFFPLCEFPVEEDSEAIEPDLSYAGPEDIAEPYYEDDRAAWALAMVRPTAEVRGKMLYHVLAHAEAVTGIDTVQQLEDIADMNLERLVLEIKGLALAIRLDPSELPLQSCRQFAFPMALVCSQCMTMLDAEDEAEKVLLLHTIGDILPFAIAEPADVLAMLRPLAGVLSRASRRSSSSLAALTARAFASFEWDDETWADAGRYVATFLRDDDVPEDAKAPFMWDIIHALCDTVGEAGLLKRELPPPLDEDDARVNEGFTQEGVNYAKA
ncbi:hypothetical protein J8273_7386 [Carpediemonas membranifera]|uniref:HEAT repeat protein n=1 Tax=Carpediemonas membranifera TaxID=201153 RepID=A0A8J6B1N8_9EUKA|nr:hypothetical protein J8273_7386 [Carpediemonas membranifera]|eukprot:KAG9391112.1 hypothetical protein J8273_7386 [Carpediemonas membranifera]